MPCFVQWQQQKRTVFFQELYSEVLFCYAAVWFAGETEADSDRVRGDEKSWRSTLKNKILESPLKHFFTTGLIVYMYFIASLHIIIFKDLYGSCGGPCCGFEKAVGLILCQRFCQYIGRRGHLGCRLPLQIGQHDFVLAKVKYCPSLNTRTHLQGRILSSYMCSIVHNVHAAKTGSNS